MKYVIKKMLSFMQNVMLYISYYFSCIVFKKCTSTSWVICGENISYSITNLAKILENTTTVCFSKNPLAISFKMDYYLDNMFLRLFYSPIIFGFLAAKNSHFLYIFNVGFMLNKEFEFKFLNKEFKKIVCLYLGDDIRSPKLMIEFCNKLGLDHCLRYEAWQNSYCLSQKYDNERKRLAYITDKYADFVFGDDIDQRSYLVLKKQHNYTYFYDKEKVFKIPDKFKQNEIKILHAPSNPIVKGTPLVRAAIKKLQVEGYKFNYIELINVPNHTVLDHLREAHIVLNQFYGFLPGLFGIEAMANNCAVLMSADPNIGCTLPRDINDAWLITKYWQIYDNLKFLLDNPIKIRYYANNGCDFVIKHYNFDTASAYINKTLHDNKII